MGSTKDKQSLEASDITYRESTNLENLAGEQG